MSRLPDGLDHARPVLIYGPTASGKSELALRIAERFGGGFPWKSSKLPYGLDTQKNYGTRTKNQSLPASIGKSWIQKNKKQLKCWVMTKPLGMLRMTK